jgi:probable rRNA maturation factor
MIVEIRNRQRTQPVDLPLLKSITLQVLEEHLDLTEVELGIHLVSAREMARVNQQYLQHEGSTDVITFDHSLVPVSRPTVPTPIHGELFICVEDAKAQAVEFGTSWQEEVVRYVIHGILHLCGYDDLKPAPRREMKQEESRLLRKVAKVHDLERIGRQLKRTASAGKRRTAS